jgi:hypothetical protein
MLPGTECVPILPIDRTPALATGRPGMTPESCFVFLIVRGYLGSIKSVEARDFIAESFTLNAFLARRGLPMPSFTTILENLNKISQKTLNAIFDAQIRWLGNTKMDTFENITCDSTACSANSCWPTDSGLIHGLTERLWLASQSLSKFGLTNMAAQEIPEILQELYAHNFQIALAAGKKDATKRRQEAYRGFLDLAEIANQTFAGAIPGFREQASRGKLIPSQKRSVENLIARAEDDLAMMTQLIVNASLRVLQEEPVPSADRVTSISDPDAAFISKGQRDTVVGYRPQLSKSEKGFVTGLIVPEGNAADSGQAMPLFNQTVARTGVTPRVSSWDDGYSSQKNKEDLHRAGVEVVSFSGSKGRKITLPEDWDSEPYREARRMRSAVESVVFQLKRGFDFGKLWRRSIQKVREELTVKVLAFNFYRCQYLLS